MNQVYRIGAVSCQRVFHWLMEVRTQINQTEALQRLGHDIIWCTQW